MQPASNDNPKSPNDPVLRQLQDAVADLTYPSESDEPWQAFVWPATGPTASARQVIEQHVDKTRAIVEVSVEAFFEQLAEADNAERYHSLRQMLQQTLNDLSVFRVGDGETQVDVNLLGTTTDGTWAGIQTRSIET